MPVDFNDKWLENDDNGTPNATKYAHISPQDVHTTKDGLLVGYDPLNKTYRPLTADKKGYNGSPNDLPKRTRVPDNEFILAYNEEKKNGGSMETLMRKLGYYGQSVQSIRAKVNNVNKMIEQAVKDKLGPKEASKVVADFQLSGLTSAFTLRGKATTQADYNSIWEALQASKKM